MANLHTGVNHAPYAAAGGWSGGINAKAQEFQAADQPVLSVDTKKKGVLQRHERSS